MNQKYKEAAIIMSIPMLSFLATLATYRVQNFGSASPVPLAGNSALARCDGLEGSALYRCQGWERVPLVEIKEAAALKPFGPQS